MCVVKVVVLVNSHFLHIYGLQCFVEPADMHDEQFLHDLPEMPTDQDLLEVQQGALLQQQEDDLRQMKNSRSVKPGSSFLSLCIRQRVLQNGSDYI